MKFFNGGLIITFSLLVLLFSNNFLYAESDWGKATNRSHPQPVITKTVDSSGNYVIVRPVVEENSDDIKTAVETVRVYDSSNSTTEDLGNGGVFTGPWALSLGFSSIEINVLTDQASAIGGLLVQESNIGTGDTYIHAHPFTFEDTTPNGRHVIFTLTAQFYRVKYTNGVTPTSGFNLSTVVSKGDLTHSHTHPINHPLDDNHGAQVTRSVITGKRDDGTYVNAEFDNKEAAQIIVDSPHHQTHAGNRFVVKDFVSMAGGAGSYVDFYFEFHIGPKEAHVTWEIAGNQEYEIELFENPTVSNSGFPLIIQNKDQNSLNTPVTGIWVGPTVVTTGTETIWSAKFGSGNKVGGLSRNSDEYLAQKGEQFILRITKVGATVGWLDLMYDWYELEPE